MNRIAACLYLTVILFSVTLAQDWKIADNPLMTPWAETLTPDNAWQEYPRPQLVREQWLNLNGLWDYSLEPVDFTPIQGLIQQESMTTGPAPATWQGKILVPFAIDSALSGVKHILRPTERIWYRRTVTIPSSWQDQRIILHIQACDWETSVYVNNQRIGQHRGGYDPFSFDITSALKSGQNELIICAWDGAEQQCQAIGKQIMPENRQGFRYQPTGGIWQTVWLEPVNPISITSLKMVPDIDNQQLYLTVNSTTDKSTDFAAAIVDGDRLITSITGQTNRKTAIPIPYPRLWSPDNPFLYDLKVSLIENNRIIDGVSSYFGMRKIEIKKAADGFTRIFLNNQVSFHFGPLDQGYWPDGILTPPSDDAARYDVQYLRDIGCNMVRVHIKTHPDRWYYWCDKLGLMVWQDMICMPKYGQTVDKPASRQWQTELNAMIGWLENHPAIVQWIVFNEAWSQHNTISFTEWVMQRDPSRLVSAASGWTDFPVGHIRDHHDYSFYPNISAPADNPNRAIVLGELGGHNIYIPNHTWYDQTKPPTSFTWTTEGGRATFANGSAWQEPYRFFLETIRCLNAAAGCNGAVYTQITDVEHECNGWLTYDRRVSKIPVATLKALHDRLYTPPVLNPVFPSGAKWQASANAKIESTGPQRNPILSGPWTRPDFKDSGWTSVTLPIRHDQSVLSAFDSASPRNNRLCLRKTFNLNQAIDQPVFKLALGRTNTGLQSTEKLDGFNPRTDIAFPVHIYLNGTLLRKTSASALDAQTAVPAPTPSPSS